MGTMGWDVQPYQRWRCRAGSMSAWQMSCALDEGTFGNDVDRFVHRAVSRFRGVRSCRGNRLSGWNIVGSAGQVAVLLSAARF